MIRRIHIRRIRRIVCKRITIVCVLHLVVAVQLHTGRYFDIIRRRIQIKIVRNIQNRLVFLYFPHTIQILIKFTCSTVSVNRFFFFKRNKISMRINCIYRLTLLVIFLHKKLLMTLITPAISPASPTLHIPISFFTIQYFFIGFDLE